MYNIVEHIDSLKITFIQLNISTCLYLNDDNILKYSHLDKSESFRLLLSASTLR